MENRLMPHLSVYVFIEAGRQFRDPAEFIIKILLVYHTIAFLRKGFFPPADLILSFVIDIFYRDESDDFPVIAAISLTINHLRY
jgi:hypothetical protein